MQINLINHTTVVNSNLEHVVDLKHYIFCRAFFVNIKPCFAKCVANAAYKIYKYTGSFLWVFHL